MASIVTPAFARPRCVSHGCPRPSRPLRRVWLSLKTLFLCFLRMYAALYAGAVSPVMALFKLAIVLVSGAFARMLPAANANAIPCEYSGFHGSSHFANCKCFRTIYSNKSPIRLLSFPPCMMSGGGTVCTDIFLYHHCNICRRKSQYYQRECFETFLLTFIIITFINFRQQQQIKSTC